MATYQVVNREEFKDLYWKRFDSYYFAANRPVVALVLDEFPKVVTEMPICFLKQESTYLAVALLALKDNSNLFVGSDGLWITSYVPAVLRGYPFALHQSQDGESVLCVDTDSGLVSKSDGENFFDTNGTPTEQITKIVGFLSSIEQQQALTVSLCSQLARLNLLKPWSFSQSPQEPPLMIDNMYQVDTDALDKLCGDDLKSIAQTGALALAYGQIFSTNNVIKLIARADKIAREQKSSATGFSLDMSESSETLNFDNL